jgi:hypothetical protein
VNHPTDDEIVWWARGLKSSAAGVALKGPDQAAAHGRRQIRTLPAPRAALDEGACWAGRGVSIRLSS